MTTSYIIHGIIFSFLVVYLNPHPHLTTYISWQTVWPLSTEIDNLTFVSWFDLGCPLSLFLRRFWSCMTKATLLQRVSKLFSFTGHPRTKQITCVAYPLSIDQMKNKKPNYIHFPCQLGDMRIALFNRCRKRHRWLKWWTK